MGEAMQPHMVALISSAVGFVVVVIGWAVRKIEMRKVEDSKRHANTLAQLDLEAQRLAIEQELLAERKKRTTGRATPTGLRHATVKSSASQSFPHVAEADLDEAIKRGAKAASTLVKRVAPSIMPTARESAEHALNLPPLDDMPTLDLSAVQDAHEGEE